MKINLREYATELAYWIEGFKPFVDTRFVRTLSVLQEELENGRDNLRHNFRWKLPTPVQTRPTNRYDGQNKSPHKVWIGWQFECEFETGPDTRKKFIWLVKNMVTHIRVHSTEDNSEILHFHCDLKNEGQLGPHVHMQLSEHYVKNKGKIPIAVPRFPAATMLPTDCLDLVLSEFFPFEWPKSQSNITGLSVLQNRQRERLQKISEAQVQNWARLRMTPVAATQNWYMPDLQIA